MIDVDIGQGPLLLSFPDCGTDIHPAVGNRLNATGRMQTDISWHLDDLFNFAADIGATTVKTTTSRYVMDMNRDPSAIREEDVGLFGLVCPVSGLDKKRIYRPHEEPGPAEIEERRRLYHAPYHDTLAAQLKRLRKSHSTVVLVDCRSIRSRIRGHIEDRLPVYNLGTLDGKSCSLDLPALFTDKASPVEADTVGLNGHEKGGFVVESHADPSDGIHGLSLTLAQRCYLRMEAPPFEPDKTRVNRMRSVLGTLMKRLSDWAEKGGPTVPANVPGSADAFARKLVASAVKSPAAQSKPAGQPQQKSGAAEDVPSATNPPGAAKADQPSETASVS